MNKRSLLLYHRLAAELCVLPVKRPYNLSCADFKRLLEVVGLERLEAMKAEEVHNWLDKHNAEYQIIK